ncbi:MAG: hypothetical protein C0404_11610 [Verrucomicrobia bacterium]|nr:hypothetical protein [Verrucomicrobiota bacterium]
MTDLRHAAISAGDILRTSWPARMADHVNLYMGSGRSGGCFDVWGLMHARPGAIPQEGDSVSRTVLMHADHWHRGAFGLDYWMPVARLLWAGAEPPRPDGYRQELHLYDGVLETELAWPKLKVHFRACFNPDRRDLLAVEVRYEAGQGGAMPGLLLAPEVDHPKLHYCGRVTGRFEVLEREAGWWLGGISAGTAETMLGLRVISDEGGTELRSVNGGVEIRFQESRGRHLLLIGTAGAVRRAELAKELSLTPGAERYFTEAAEAWHRRWGDAFIQVPVREYQAMWARSQFYVLSSYAPDVRSPAPPNGWTGNAWPFHFPQDLSYIHPALLRLGHFDIARSWVEFYRNHLASTVEVTKRVYKVAGAMWAWEHPIGPDTKMLMDGSPNWFQYEIHNAAYPLRMAYETSQYLGDERWTREVAWPVIEESARFYGSTLKCEADGKWSLHVVPSMGQDEFGGRDAKNYLCALHSARYSLAVATRMARQLGKETSEIAAWRRMLDDGLSFHRLYLKDEGVCSTCEGLKKEDFFGRQKHPVQLAPLVFVPLDVPEECVVNAYRRRYEICVGPEGKRFCGWTLAAYWLASVRMGDADGLRRGLGQAAPSGYVDPDWIQIFESAGKKDAPFFITSHGLCLQALNDMFVDSRWDGVQLGSGCPAELSAAKFGNLRVPGRRLSGERSDAKWAVHA